MNVRGSGCEARSGVGGSEALIKKTFRFKITFNSPGCPLCLLSPDLRPPPHPALQPSLPLMVFWVCVWGGSANSWGL